MPANPVPWFVKQQASQMNRAPLTVGAVRGNTPGRADKLPVRVPQGSYVLPSAVISHFGQNNTDSGFQVADKMFRVAPVPHLPMKRADGGAAGDDEGTEILISDGEYVVPPEKVSEWGGGDIDIGHKALDIAVKRWLAEHAKAASKLPGPARD